MHLIITEIAKTSQKPLWDFSDHIIRTLLGKIHKTYAKLCIVWLTFRRRIYSNLISHDFLLFCPGMHVSYPGPYSIYWFMQTLHKCENISSKLTLFMQCLLISPNITGSLEKTSYSQLYLMTFEYLWPNLELNFSAIKRPPIPIL